MQQMNYGARTPSRLSYRIQRLLLTPLLWKLAKICILLFVAIGVGANFHFDERKRESVTLYLADIRNQIEMRPEFMISFLAVGGASAEVEREIRETFPHQLPSSSFDVDLEAIQAMIMEMPIINDVDVRIGQGGTMSIDVVERQPAAVWLKNGELRLIDADGVKIDTPSSREEHPDIPLLAGMGAGQMVGEAIALHDVLESVEDRVVGLVRVGERRWDVVLNRNLRILLPEADPVSALKRVVYLNDTDAKILDRNLSVVDMRLAERPTIRIAGGRADNW
ncbi:MAG: cell division protein FtsQ/DivIB [Roseovarius sp.]|nr:cell division protein FtsQ/DivIB [Roseovarius sp.]